MPFTFKTNRVSQEAGAKVQLLFILASFFESFLEKFISQFLLPNYPRNIFKNLTPFGSAKIITFYSLATIFSNFFIRSFFVAI